MSIYNVVLKSKDDLEQFYLDMESDFPNSLELKRPISRTTCYNLTQQQADIVSSDNRVLAVEKAEEGSLGPAGGWTRTSSNWAKSPMTVNSADHDNWALLRCISNPTTTNWGSDGGVNVSGTVTTTHDGTGVDVVVCDGHVNPDHPEFAVNADGTGGSRVNQYNWLSSSSSNYDYSIGSSRLKAHGDAVAGLAAGNTQGFASGANIFNINPYSGDAPSLGSGSHFSNMMDILRQWHENKTINSNGYRNPSVLNLSIYHTHSSPNYGDSADDRPWARVSDIASINYRNQTYTNPGIARLKASKVQCGLEVKTRFRTAAAASSGATSLTVFFTTDTDELFAINSFTNSASWSYAASNSIMVGRTIQSISATGNTHTYDNVSYNTYTITLDAGINSAAAINFGFTFLYSEECLSAPSFQSTSLEADLVDMLDENVHVFVGAGNQNQYIDVKDSLDYNNTITLNTIGSSATNTYYYNRPIWLGSDPRTHVIGAMDSTVVEQKATFSNKGPRVDLFAPGVGCQSASNSYHSLSVADPRAIGSAATTQRLRLFDGTSAACPQSSGAFAAALEAAPYLESSVAKQFLLERCFEDDLVDSGSTDSTNERNLMGARNRVLKYSTPVNYITTARGMEEVKYASMTTIGTFISVNQSLTIERDLSTGSNAKTIVTLNATDDNDHISDLLFFNRYFTFTTTNCSIEDVDGNSNPTTIGTGQAMVIRPSAVGAYQVVATITHSKPQGGTATKTFTVKGRADSPVAHNTGYGIQIWKENETVFPRLDTSDLQTFFYALYTGTIARGSSTTLTIPNLDITSSDWGISFGGAGVYWEIEQPQVGQLTISHLTADFLLAPTNYELRIFKLDTD
jgi:hypothetical protein